MFCISKTIADRKKLVLFLESAGQIYPETSVTFESPKCVLTSVIFDTLHMNINTIIDDFNSIHPNIQFTDETEQDNRINYLDIAIHRKRTHINISIFRKPTHTDTLIPYTSNHPAQQKYAAIKFLYNRLNSYQLHNEEYQQENIIHNILYNNCVPLQNHTHKRQQNYTKNQKSSKELHLHNPPKKWCTFTYIGKETLLITKIFKQANLQIAYRTNNTLQKHLSYNSQQDKFTQSGIYKLTCPDCNKAYIGQTGRDFYARYNEHKRAFKYNTQHSKFAQLLLNTDTPSGI
jgi:hypothetical protein